MATTVKPATPSAMAEDVGTDPTDVLVVFGITGDLAKVMTFRSLYSLEPRGLLNCPIVGVAVDDWTRRRPAQARAGVDRGRRRAVDEQVFERFAARLSYVSGDFADAATYERVAAAIADAKNPVFYLEIPPFLFGTVIKGLADAGLTEERARGRREAVRPRRRLGARRSTTRSTSTSTSRSSTGSTTSSGRWASSRSSTCGSRTRCSSRSGTATTSRPCRSRWRRTSASTTAATSTTRWARVRDVVVNHLMQVVAAAAMEPPAGPDRRRLKDAMFSVFRAMPDADPAHYVRGQYEGYRTIDGVAPDSKTETYAALRLEIDNWRWSGVPFFIRTGKHLPVTQTELRLVFRRPAAARLPPSRSRRPEPDQLVVKLDPTTGIQLLVEAQRADGREPEQISLDMEFGAGGR